MTARVKVNRLLVITIDVEDDDIEPGESVASTALAIARDIHEPEWLVADEWVEP